MTGSATYAFFNSAGSSPYFFEARPAAISAILERTGSSLPATAVACLRSFSGPAEALRLYLGKLVMLIVPFESPDNFNFYYAALRSPLLRALPGYGLLVALAAVGLALVRSRWRKACIWLPVPVALLMSFLLTSPLSRYRATFAVFLLPFAGLACATGAEELRRRRWGRAAALAGAALAVGGAALLLQRQIVFADRPAGAFRYRAAEFVLSAQVYAGRHDLAGAARELLLLARLNPRLSDKVNAHLMLADLAARGGSRPLARAALASAARLGARDGFALLAVGDAYWELLRDRQGALAAYRAAQRAPGPERLRAAAGERVRGMEAPAGQRVTAP